MSFVRDRKRDLKLVTEIDKIDGILRKYINTGNLFLKSPLENDRVDYVSRDEKTITLTFSHELTEKEAAVYTFVSDRYVQFNLEVESKAGGGRPPCTYVMKIKSCALAAEKRIEDRYSFETDHPRITKIMVSKVRESEAELRKSIAVQVIIKDFLDRLEEYDLKKAYFGNEKDIPAEVLFVTEKKKAVVVADLRDMKAFFSENDPFIKSAFDSKFRSDLEVGFRKYSKEFRSLVIQPVEFQSLLGDVFLVCYLVLATRERGIDADEAERIAGFSSEISEKIHKGNYREFDAKGKVVNISMSGALVEIDDENLIKNLSLLDGILFNLVFKLRDPIRISALVVYIKNVDKGVYNIGIEFKGSFFGPECRKVIEERLRTMNRAPG